jgi:valyl-tRNA synthetase
MPHITEEIYQEIFRDREGDESVHLSSWPEPQGVPESSLGQLCVEIISSLRKWKSDRGLALNTEIQDLIIFSPVSLEPIYADLTQAMNIKNLQIKSGTPDIEERIVKVVPDYKVIGPQFGEKTRDVVKKLQDPAVVTRIESGETVTEYALSKNHIARIEKEYRAEGRKVDIITGESYLIEIF